MAQQALGGHEDQWLTERRLDLPPQQMKVLRWGGRVGHLHVVIGAKLEKTLQSGAGMLRSQALPAVGQQQGQSAQLLPLGLAAGDKQVDDALGVIDKIAELGLPQGEHLGPGDRVAVFKTQHTGLGQQAVIHLKRGLSRFQTIQGGVGLARLIVPDDAVALTEGAAAHILTAEPNRVAFGDEGRKGQGLGTGPVDAFTGVNGVEPLVQHTLQPGVDGKPRGQIGQPAGQFDQRLLVHRSIDRFRGKRPADRLPFRKEPGVGKKAGGAVDFLKGRIEAAGNALFYFLHLRFR